MANLYNVPIPEPTEEGKVLTVVNGEWQAAEGGSLPTVTSTDDGKVLTVIDGAWGVGEGGSGGGGGIATTILTLNGTTATTDKTYNDLKDADGIIAISKRTVRENYYNYQFYTVIYFGMDEDVYELQIQAFNSPESVTLYAQSPDDVFSVTMEGEGD